VPAGLTAAQPDLGTAILITIAGVLLVFRAGLSAGVIAGAVALAGVASWVGWQYLLRDYQRQRVLTFIDPQTDPLGAGYHIIQSQIAIGSGGLFGKGYMNGSQSQLVYLPERHTDFIYAVMGEEFGLLGLAVLLLLYVFLVGRALFLATQTQDTFARLLAGSLALTFFVYVFINAGMVSGLLPVVGVPLPLVSYGGTSMVTLLASFGILMSMYSHRKLVGS
jgi:rod shape determining protein RodA